MKMKSDKRELDKVYKRRDRYEIPDWQRDEVWDPPRKQALIDSILRGWRLPKFYFVASSAKPQSTVTRSIGPSGAIATTRAARWLRVLA